MTSTTVSRKIVVGPNDELYIVEGAPGSYRLLALTTREIGLFKRSWQAVESALKGRNN